MFSVSHTTTPILLDRLRAPIAIVACLALLSCAASAQDPIFGDTPDFGDGGGLFGEDPMPAPTVDDRTEIEQEEDDALSRQLMEYSRRGSLQLADAISSLVRLGRWRDVQTLLARTAGKNIDEKTLAEMFKVIGPTNYLKIKQQSNLSGSAQAGIDKIQKAASAFMQSPERLAAAIEQLGSASREDRLEATRTLLNGGDAATQALVGAAVQEQPASKRDDILRTIIALGGGGTDAIRQLALYGKPEVRARALDCLGRISAREHIVDLVTGLHAQDASEAERKISAAYLDRLDGVPTRDASIEALAFDLRHVHDLAKQFKNDGQVITLWSLNEGLDGVKHQSALAMHATYREVYDDAARLHRIGNLPTELNAAVLAAAMGYHLIIDPDWGDADQVQPIRESYRSAVDGQSVSDVIDYVLRTDDHAATIGLIRLIDSEAINDTARHALLDGSAGVPAPLVRAARSPEPRVRYEAALKITDIAGELHYAGSSQVARTLSEMVHLSNKPTVILVETRSEVILPAETFLGNLGLNVEVASTVAEVQRVIAAGGDIRLLLAKNELADLPAIEMIDLVRRMHRGRELPIVIYGDHVPYLGAPRWNANTSWIEGDVSLSSLQELFDIVQRSRRMPALTILDRQRYRDAAAEILMP